MYCNYLYSSLLSHFEARWTSTRWKTPSQIVGQACVASWSFLTEPLKINKVATALWIVTPKASMALVVNLAMSSAYNPTPVAWLFQIMKQRLHIAYNTPVSLLYVQHPELREGVADLCKRQGLRKWQEYKAESFSLSPPSLFPALTPCPPKPKDSQSRQDISYPFHMSLGLSTFTFSHNL